MAVGDIKDHREEDLLSLDINWGRVNFDSTDLTVGQPVGKHKYIVLGFQCHLASVRDLGGRENVDHLYVHVAQRGTRVAVENFGSLVGINDLAGDWLDQQHHRGVSLEHGAEALFTLDQRFLSLLAAYAQCIDGGQPFQHYQVLLGIFKPGVGQGNLPNQRLAMHGWHR